MRCLALIVASLTLTAHAAAQDISDLGVQRGPRFLYAAASNKPPVRVDVRRSPVLTRRISLDLRDVSLEDALEAITRQAGLKLSYSKALVPLNKSVRLMAQEITVAGAISEVLFDVDVDVLFTASGQAILVARRDIAEAVRVAGTITGRVADAVSAQPLGRAEIRVTGTRLATTTNDAGEYTLRGVPAGEQRISARRIGYEAQTQAVNVTDGGTTTLDFALQVLPTRLGQIVSTATGGQRRLEVGNAIATVRADSTVARAPVRDLGDLINGRAPGVLVVFGNGVAGVAPQFRIRGTNSITVSNDPIVIVDGIRFENSPGRSPFDFRIGTSFHRTGRLADINPEEIETLEVVKGPSAATLYGTDAANGVIVITTKRGSAGRTAWTAYVEQGTSAVHNVKWPTNYYAWGRSSVTGAVQQCLLVARAAGTCLQDSVTAFNPLRDAPNSPLNTGHRQQYGVQVAGGTSALRYFVAGELEDESGYLALTDGEQKFLRTQRGGAPIPDWQVRPNALTRVSTRGNVSANLGATAHLTVNAGLVRNRTRLPDNSLIANATQFARGSADTLRQWGGVGLRPAFAFLRQQLEDVTHFTTGLNSNWRVRPWLETRGSVGIDFSNDDFSHLLRRGDDPTDALGGRRVKQDENISLYTADIGASASFVPRPNLSARTSVGVQYNQRSEHTAGAVATGLAPGSELVTGAATVSGFEATSKSIVAGSYFEQMFGYANQLFMTAAIRLDGASSFGRDFTTAAYPKASISWLVPATSWREVLGITMLRLRGAFGASGVQPSPIASLARVTLFTSVVNGVLTNGAAPIAVGNPNLRPERQRELEAGFDAEVFDNRLQVEFTVYNRQSIDALIDEPLAGSFGIGRFGVRPVNIGRVRNRGLEGLLGARVLDRDEIAWDVSLNGNVNQNRLLRLAPDLPRIGTAQTRHVPGYPVNSLWDRRILSYADANGNGIIELSEVTIGDTAIFYGPLLPTRQLTGTTSIELFRKTLRITALTDYRGGHKRWNSTEGTRCLSFFSSCQAVNDPSAPFDRQAAAVARNSSRNVWSGYFEDGDYVSFRELSLSYTSAALARITRARSAVLTISSRNLATFSDYTGIATEGTNFPGVDTFSDSPNVYPARYFIARLTLGL